MEDSDDGPLNYGIDAMLHELGDVDPELDEPPRFVPSDTESPPPRAPAAEPDLAQLSKGANVDWEA